MNLGTLISQLLVGASFQLQHIHGENTHIPRAYFDLHQVEKIMFFFNLSEHFCFFTYYTGNSDSKDRRGEPFTLRLLSFLQYTISVVFPLLNLCNFVHLWLLCVYFSLNCFHNNLMEKSDRNKYSLFLNVDVFSVVYKMLAFCHLYMVFSPVM